MSLPLPSSLTLPKSWNVIPASISSLFTQGERNSHPFSELLWRYIWKHALECSLETHYANLSITYLQRPFQILMSFPDFSDHLQNLATVSVFVSYTHAFVIFTIHVCTPIYIYTFVLLICLSLVHEPMYLRLINNTKHEMPTEAVNSLRAAIRM